MLSGWFQSRAELSEDEVRQRVESVRGRLLESFPDLKIVADASEICNDFSLDISRLPNFCTFVQIRRFLTTGNYDVESAVTMLRRCYDLERSTRLAQSSAVEEVLCSKRFRYVGHSRGGTIVLCIDCLWGGLLSVEGGLDTVMTALGVFWYRRLWTMVERDIGRAAVLAQPPIALLFVGGTPPINFFRAGSQFVRDHRPNGLALGVLFETNSYRGVFAKNALNWLPKSRTQYQWTNTRAHLLELLDIEGRCIPESMLYTDVPETEQLAATGKIDLEWGQEMEKSRVQGTSELSEDLQQARCAVKNTFVEPLGDSSPVARRGRSYSDSVPANRALSPRYVHLDDMASSAEHDEQGSELYTPAELSKPKNKRKRGSGWTRQRRNRALKMQLALDAGQLPAHTEIIGDVAPQ